MAEYSGEHKVGWNTIAVAMKATEGGAWLRACCHLLPHLAFMQFMQDMIKKITDMKFEMPRQSEAASLSPHASPWHADQKTFNQDQKFFNQDQKNI